MLNSQVQNCNSGNSQLRLRILIVHTCGLTWMLILLQVFESSVKSLIRTALVSLQEITAACFLISFSGCKVLHGNNEAGGSCPEKRVQAYKNTQCWQKIVGLEHRSRNTPSSFFMHNFLLSESPLVTIFLAAIFKLWSTDD